MVVFHSYISLPEGNDSIPNMFIGKIPQESVRLEVTLQSAETSAIKVSAQSGAQKRELTWIRIVHNYGLWQLEL